LVTFSTSFVWANAVPLKNKNSSAAINSLDFILEILKEWKGKEIRLAMERRLSIYKGK
jgi:hypothetical protein